MVIDKFKDVFSVEQILVDEPMKNHTSFKTGGIADVLLLPISISQIASAERICSAENIPFFIMGNGSNLLVKDNGFRGVVIKTANFKTISISDDVLTVESGALLSEIADFALQKSLKGLEFASGIPGTLGGAVFMNAGAYDGEIKNVLIDALVLNGTGDIYTLSNEELNFGYRTSRVQKEDLTVLSARLQLEQGEFIKIKEKMDDLNTRRKDKQPLEMPSAGSTFKRPVGNYASKLIDDNGLRGFTIGGAQVSEKHCGFVVNKGDATSKDILDLIKYISEVVENNSSVVLEPEVRIIGD